MNAYVSKKQECGTICHIDCHAGDMFPSCKNSVYNVSLTGSEDIHDYGSQFTSLECFMSNLASNYCDYD